MGVKTAISKTDETIISRMAEIDEEKAKVEHSKVIAKRIAALLAEECVTVDVAERALDRAKRIIFAGTRVSIKGGDNKAS